MSVPRMTTSSTQPRAWPASMPSGTPSTAAMPTDTTPTSTVVCAPTISRLRVSMPI